MISVIMASFLGEYANCANNREEKFIRAVKSFLANVHNDKELIIVSDGCQITNRLYEENFTKYDNIKLVKTTKKRTFSGAIRQIGINEAKGELICYLDTDDYLTPTHLNSIVNGFTNTNFDWVYYNDYIKTSINSSEVRIVNIKEGVIGTSSIAHKKHINAEWLGCHGYGHDWKFIEQLKSNHKKYNKIFGCGYVVCHVYGKALDF